MSFDTPGRHNVTVLIATRNRKDEVLRTVESCLAQSEIPQVRVLDDASSDGTAAAVLSAFPCVEVRRFDESAGQAARRNQGFAEARTPIVVSLDDDVVLDDAFVLADTIADFTSDRIGAVAIPIFDEGAPPGWSAEPAPRGMDLVVPILKAGSFAARREVFLAAGGFPRIFIGQGEETDLCLRLLALGYFVKLGTASPIRHCPSPIRDVRRMDYYGRRNDLLVGGLTMPATELPVHLARCAVRTGRLVAQQRRFAWHLRGTWAGCRDSVRYRKLRRPVPAHAAKFDRILRRRRRMSLEEALLYFEKAASTTWERS
jgi:glycosyltransferase involved in cell wall biosynthesis